MCAEISKSLMRTNNACESFHLKLNGMFYSSYLNIFKFVEIDSFYTIIRYTLEQ